MNMQIIDFGNSHIINYIYSGSNRKKIGKIRITEILEALY